MMFAMILWMGISGSYTSVHQEFQTEALCEAALHKVDVFNNTSRAPYVGGVCVKIRDDQNK